MSEFQDFMEEVKDEIKNAPKMFRQLQKRDEEIKDLKQQRDDLLKACDKAKDEIGGFLGCCGEDEKKDSYQGFVNVCNLLEAELAKAK